MDLTSYIVGLFLGILSSLIVAMFVELKRKPQLSISILGPEEVPLHGDGKKIGTLIALRARVSNDSLPFALCWMQRQSARDCRATVHFLREDQTPFIDRPMPGRWAGSVEPVPLQGAIRPSGETIEIFDIARLNADSRIHIPAGETENLDIAVRFTDDTNAFGWTNESYRHPRNRHPDFALPKGRYVVEILVQSEGVKKQERFRLENDHTIKEFRLAQL
jgi:hypothetical protein